MADHRTPPHAPSGGEPTVPHSPYPGFPPPEAETRPASHAGRRRARGPVPLLAAVAVGAAVVGGGTAVGVQELTGGDSDSVTSGTVPGSNASTGGGTVADAARTVTPSVVEISAGSGTGESTGSGVVISEDGEILTNNHVVSGSGSVRVTFHDGRSAEADVVGTSPDHDMALLDARDVSGLQAAALGDSDQVGVGDQVVAIGSPGGLTGTVTSGIVSALNRDVTVEKDEGRTGGGHWPFEFGGGEYNGDVGSSTTTYKAIQTDTSLNPGNSGGALVDLDGKVIGINSAMHSSGSSAGSGSGSGGSVGLNFAIPVNDVKEILDDLRGGGS